MVGTWRHTELEAVLGGPVDLKTMTEATVRALVEAFPDESEFVDFKRRNVFTATRKDRDELRHEWGKDVAAFANGRGGIIIFGVVDSRAVDKGQDRVEPFDAEVADLDLIDQFKSAIRATVMPVPAFDIAAIPVGEGDGQFVLVCVVPPSSLAPHAVTSFRDKERAVIYPVRTAGASHTEFLREHQIAGMYQQRGQAVQDRRRRTDAVWDTGKAGLNGSQTTVWVAVASIPDLPQDDVLAPDAIDAICEWSDSERDYPALLFREADHGGWEVPVPAPGRLVFTGSQQTSEDRVEEPVVRAAYREIHADGSAFAAISLSSEPGTAKLNVDDIVERTIVAAANALSWTTTRAGSWGAATVVAGIIAVDDGRHPMLTVGGLGGASPVTGRDVRRTISGVPGPAPTVTVVQLRDVTSMPGVLRAAYRLALPLVQLFGVPDLGWLRPDGRLGKRLPIGAHPRERERLAGWAAEHGVEFGT